jgi:hypothetical protein
MVRSAADMRTHLAAAAAALALVCAAGPAVAQEAAWWTQRITFGAGPAFVENLWAKGRKMRAESVVEGRRILTFVDEKRYVIVDDLGRNGIAIERSAHSIGQDGKRRRPFGNEAEDITKQGGEKVGEEMKAGQDVDHYRVTTGSGDRDEVWVTQDAGRLPLESLFRDRQTGAMSRRIYLRWVEAAYPDEFFAPAREIKLETMTYEEYTSRSKTGPVGPAPPFYSDLLHGARE